MFSFSLVTPPAVEPLTLTEAKAHLRLDTSADDALIGTLIAGARQWAERYTGRAFITQTWALSVDRIPSDRDERDGMVDGAIGSLDGLRALNLPRAPLQTVTGVQTFDNDDTAHTFSADNYYVDTAHEPGRIVLRSGAVWPYAERDANSIVVTYTAGYGAAASDVPAPLRTAIAGIVAHSYQNRGDANAVVPASVRALLDPYRVRFSGA
ncbi:MAG: head-tail connector protein [Alphaproteobacteria bacterium]|nr:head-tail connector protein [Alphaproteobacteria bacterium]